MSGVWSGRLLHLSVNSAQMMLRQNTLGEVSMWSSRNAQDYSRPFP